MSLCRVCAEPVTVFMNFGPMPLSGRFPLPEQVADERLFPLEASLCPGCALVQLTHPAPAELMFGDGYTFFSSSSRRMQMHFDGFAKWTLAALAPSQIPFVVEIGSNDGCMLEAFARRGARVLGVEPAPNVAAVARARGLRVRIAFFDEDVGRKLREEEGPADAIVATNCICHVAQIGALLRGIRHLLAADGLFVFESPYLGDVLRLNAFDQIYDEHVFYFCATSVRRMVARYGLTLVGLQYQPVHGGSMRYVLTHAGRGEPTHALTAPLADEAAHRLGTLDSCIRLAQAASRARDELQAVLRKFRHAGLRVAGYAATAKSATLLNYCRIDSTLLPWICDTTAEKHGRLTPGSHIPVVPHDVFKRERPDVALLLAWNHAAEIMDEEREFTTAGGRWIVHVPRVRVLAPGEPLSLAPGGN